jgi:hypothetical protein
MQMPCRCTDMALVDLLTPTMIPLIRLFEHREGHRALQHAHLPENLRFLKEGYDLHLEP